MQCHAGGHFGDTSTYTDTHTQESQRKWTGNSAETKTQTVLDGGRGRKTDELIDIKGIERKREPERKWVGDEGVKC